MSDGKDEWFVSRGGQSFGPVPFEKVIEAAQAGRIEPRTDMLFGGDLKDWVPAGEVPGVFEKSEPKPEESAAPGAPPALPEEPRQTLADTGHFDPNEDRPFAAMDFPGTQRLGFFLGVTVLPMALTVAIFFLLMQTNETLGKFSPLLALLLLIPVLVMIVVTKRRFNNVGMSGWWLLLLWVPFLNLWLQYRLFCCPPGYTYIGKMDGIGKFLAAIFWILVIVSMAFPLATTAIPNDSNLAVSIREHTQQLKNTFEDYVDEFAKKKKKSEED